MSSSKSNFKTILDLVEAYDAEANKKYKKGKFLGKVYQPVSSFLFPSCFLPLQGGFAHCYELIDAETKKVYAGKIVPKSMLTKPHQKAKVTSYLRVH